MRFPGGNDGIANDHFVKNMVSAKLILGYVWLKKWRDKKGSLASNEVLSLTIPKP